MLLLPTPVRQTAPIEFQVKWLFGSVNKKRKIDFQDGHLGFQIKMILAMFDLQITPMLPTKFQVNWPFGLGEEAENRFSIWPPWWPFWISDKNDFSYF